MKKIELNEVHNFWNSESCGERYALGEDDKEKFLTETKNRYDLEPYIKIFAEFEKFRGLDVLEIGVGFGSDHSQIAEQQPKTLTGIDLTERAIENTKTRFKTLGLIVHCILTMLKHYRLSQIPLMRYIAGVFCITLPTLKNALKRYFEY